MIRTFGSANNFPAAWCLLAAIVIHAVLLWQFRFVLRADLKNIPSSAIVVLLPASELGVASTEHGDRQAASSSRAASLGRERPLTSRQSPPAFQNESSQPTGGVSGSGEAGPGLGSVLSDSGGIGVGGVGTPSGGGASGTGSGSGSGSGGTGTSQGKPGVATGGGTPSAVNRSIVVPPSIQRRTSSYESEVYVEVDSYALFTGDFRMALNVPGNQVCLDGDILRTYEREVMTRTVTDISKCRFEDHSDKDVMRCPKEAHTTVVTYNNYLSSPVTYGVNLCLAYDQSNCYWIYRDDGPEREICRPVEYSGIWAQGTLFHYKCTKSMSQTFNHPLQYEVRFVQDIEFPEQRMRKRILHREKRSVAQCP